MAHDWAAMGLTPTKPLPDLCHARIEDYQPAIEWVKKHIARFGYFVINVTLEPYLAMWYFDVGESKVKVEHETVKTLQLNLDRLEDFRAFNPKR